MIRMTKYIEIKRLERIDGICCRLFDRWCERRAVLPLAYLMHSWPFVGKSLPEDSRLAESLGELIRGNEGAISVVEHGLIQELIELINEQRFLGGRCCKKVNRLKSVSG
jgi:hypothetical protein